MAEHRALETAPLRVKLRVEDYLLLDQSGAFDAYARTELVDGSVTYMNAQHRPHARIKSRLLVLLANALAELGIGLEAVAEATVAMSPVDAPEPDIVITSQPEGDGLIPAASVRLIVEVADTTLRADLSDKAALYARNGVPEYWVVDVSGRTIFRHRDPTLEGYQTRDETRFGERLESWTIQGLAVETDGL